MYKKHLVIPMLAFTCFACQNEQELSFQEGTTETKTDEVQFFSDSSVFAPNNNLNITPNTIPVENVSAPTPTPAPSTPPPTTNAPGVKLNPPHGQPGHRCDVQVGAPLPSTPAPAPTQTPQTVTIPAPSPAPAPAPNPISVNPNAKLNPPHGEPGHRCDIQVGAPLPE